MSTKLKTYTDEHLKQYQPLIDSEKKVVNTAADSNLQIVKDNYNAQIADKKQEYNDLYDQNEVQRIINERTIAENMANMGLTDSGLNRTQQTANQLSYSNNKSKISVEQQRAIDTLARSMLASTTEIENNRSASLSGIDSKYYNLAVGDATSRINTETEQAAAIEKAKIEAAAKATQQKAEAAAKLEQQKAEDKLTVIQHLNNNKLTSAGKQLYIDWFGNKYGISDADLKAMFNVNTKYAYTDDDIGITGDTGYGTADLGNSLYFNNLVSQVTDDYIKNNENRGKLVDDVISLEFQNGWSEDTTAAVYNGVLQRTESIRAFSANPTLLQYTLVSRPKNGTYIGEVANTAVVRDQFGVERTIEEVYYWIKVMHAKAEAARKYVKNFDSLSAELQKQHMANISESDINKYINTKAVKDAAKKAIKKIQENVGITK